MHNPDNMLTEFCTCLGKPLMLVMAKLQLCFVIIEVFGINHAKY